MFDVRFVTLFARHLSLHIHVFNSWASQRQVFGKPLTAQAVIRSKLAAMIARVESLQTWVENITYQMNNMVGPRGGSHGTSMVVNTGFLSPTSSKPPSWQGEAILALTDCRLLTPSL